MFLLINAAPFSGKSICHNKRQVTKEHGVSHGIARRRFRWLPSEVKVHAGTGKHVAPRVGVEQVYGEARFPPSKILKEMEPDLGH